MLDNAVIIHPLTNLARNEVKHHFNPPFNSLLCFAFSVQLKKWAVQDSNQNLQDTANKVVSENTQNQEVHNRAHVLTIYPELQQIITTWPSLPDDIKETIKTLIDAYIAPEK